MVTTHGLILVAYVIKSIKAEEAVDNVLHMRVAALLMSIARLADDVFHFKSDVPANCMQMITRCGLMAT